MKTGEQECRRQCREWGQLLGTDCDHLRYLGGEGNAASKHAPLGPELSRRRGKLKLLHFRRASPTASPMRNTMNSTMGDALGKGEPASKAS